MFLIMSFLAILCLKAFIMPFQNPSAASTALGSHKVYLFFLVLDFLVDVFCSLSGLILNVISIFLEEMFGFCEVQF